MSSQAETFTHGEITLEQLRKAVATLKEHAKPSLRNVVVVSHGKAYFGVVEDDDSVTRTSADFDASELQYESLRDSRW